LPVKLISLPLYLGDIQISSYLFGLCAFYHFLLLQITAELPTPREDGRLSLFSLDRLRNSQSAASNSKFLELMDCFRPN
jgi:hypothetical protein